MLKLNLTKYGLSKDIDNYWKKINYNASPEEYVAIIRHLSRLPLYRKIECLEEILSANILNGQYTKIVKDYLTDYYRNLEEFKINSRDDIVYTVTIDNDKDVIAISRDFETIINTPIQKDFDWIESFSMCKTRFMKPGEEYDTFTEAYVKFDVNGNVLSYSFENMKEIPLAMIEFPIDFTKDDIFIYNYDKNRDTIIFDFTYNKPCKVNKYCDCCALACIYHQHDGSLYHDHCNPIFLERISFEEIDDEVTKNEILEYFKEKESEK